MNISIEKAKILQQIFNGIPQRFVGLSQGSSKFNYACLKTCKKIDEAMKPFDELIFNKQIDCASVDEKGNIIGLDTAKFSYTPEKKKELESFYRAEIQKEISFDPFKNSNIPDNIKSDLSLLELLNGVIFDINIEDYLSDGKNDIAPNTVELEKI